MLEVLLDILTDTTVKDLCSHELQELRWHQAYAAAVSHLSGLRQYSWSRHWNAVSLFACLSSLLCWLKHTLIHMAISPLSDVPPPHYLQMVTHEAFFVSPPPQLKSNRYIPYKISFETKFIWRCVIQMISIYFKPPLGKGLKKLGLRFNAERGLKLRSL